MTSLEEVRAFLEKYQAGNVGKHNQSNQDRLPSDGAVATRQQKIWKEADEHQIPITEYEIRIEEDNTRPDHPKEYRIPERIYAVEEMWDEYTEKHGLTAFCTYIPFHQEPDEAGIYLHQRGLRFLGHLFYDWSRVHTIESTPRKQATALHERKLSKTNELLFERPAFESRRSAFQFAQEFMLRYLWFIHQIEVLAAYLEDSLGNICWKQFENEEGLGVGTESTLIEDAAICYAVRSSALAQYTPSEISRKLLAFRALEGRYRSYSNFIRSIQDFNDICRGITSELAFLIGEKTPSPSIGALGDEIPFNRNIHESTPEKLPIYVTRNEFDPDNGINGRGIVLETDWNINESETWESTYNSVSPELQNIADRARSKLENNVKHSGFEWKQCQPDNQWYFRLNQEFRGVALIKNEAEEIELLDFGEHNSPADFGCY